MTHEEIYAYWLKQTREGRQDHPIAAALMAVAQILTEAAPQVQPQPVVVPKADKPQPITVHINGQEVQVERHEETADGNWNVHTFHLAPQVHVQEAETHS